MRLSYNRSLQPRAFGINFLSSTQNIKDRAKRDALITLVRARSKIMLQPRKVGFVELPKRCAEYHHCPVSGWIVIAPAMSALFSDISPE